MQITSGLAPVRLALTAREGLNKNQFPGKLALPFFCKQGSADDLVLRLGVPWCSLCVSLVCAGLGGGLGLVMAGRGLFWSVCWVG